MLQIDVHASLPFPSTLHVLVHVNTASQCSCCMSIFMLHFHVHAACPCPYCMSMSMFMLQVHVHAACSCPYLIWAQTRRWTRTQRRTRHVGMKDCPAVSYSGTGMKKLKMSYPVRYRTKPMQSNIFSVRYRTEIMDAEMPMPMPSLAFSMSIPSYNPTKK
jgi:hypothetical protein